MAQLKSLTLRLWGLALQIASILLTLAIFAIPGSFLVLIALAVVAQVAAIALQAVGMQRAAHAALAPRRIVGRRIATKGTRALVCAGFLALRTMFRPKTPS